MITSFLLIIIFVAIIGGIIASSSSDKPAIIEANSILKITLDNEVVDRSSSNPLANFNFMSFENEKKLGLNDILKNLKKAKTDDNIKGIYIETLGVTAGIATVEEIREALIDFKESGKFILSYSDIYTQKAYYLASVANKLYINPQGAIEFKGLGAEMMFFKNALEKLGVEPVIIRGKNNKFKSAVEPFMYDKMSEANRLQTQTYMGSIWNHLLEGISVSRGISVAELNLLADSMKVENAKSAVTYKLVDNAKYKDEIIAELKELSGIEKDGKLRFVTLSKYDRVPETDKSKSKDKIAVVYGVGQIDMGEGDEASIGSDGLSESIRKARLDSTVKAIVLRVNSPGGSALASDIIWREVLLAKQVKPVIVSMGDVAASGGYYISCPADVIVANPTTITGSIGVFGVLWNGQKFLNEKIGITVDRVTTNTHSDIGSMFRPMAESEKAVIQRSVEDIYDTFISHVSEGRSITKETVDSIGQGRVWSGVNAKEIGLIDEFGGIKKAIEIAAEKAGLTDYRIVEFPKEKDPFQELLKELKGEAETYFFANELGQSYKYLKAYNNILKIKGVQARMPFELDIY
ncbi:MAG: signal peptide peptidase SppA [Bacteroidetes bacterium RIFOXYA12_FULL_33_9]|nr:MAG: signal peptide peptidase SppA [Bacteroidetes bacterium RIFOXYA12_FULL_33_9]